jgi:hypothetical protein
MSSASTPVSSEPSEAASQERAAAFIARWKASSGSERSNYISFLNELTDLLEVPRPDPATADNARNAYVFERAIEMTQRGTTGYIDLYKRGCFVCETKQGVERDEEQAALSDKLRERRRAQRKGHGIRGTAGFDQVLIKARNKAEGYARNLPADEGRPPFLIVADVGHSFELFAEFTRSGGVYTPFPDASSHRIHLADLQRPEIRERLRLVWTDLANFEGRISSGEGSPVDCFASTRKTAA